MSSDFDPVLSEMNTLISIYAGITRPRLEQNGLTWPCPDAEHPGTPVLHSGGFPRGRGLFRCIEYHLPAEEPDTDYPFLLSTGSLLHHHQTGTMTREGTGLTRLSSGARAEINPNDAQLLDIVTGDTIVIASRRGKIQIQAVVCNGPGPGTVFAPFHFPETPVNALTNNALDPVAKIPELKVCAVSIQKVA